MRAAPLAVLILAGAAVAAAAPSPPAPPVPPAPPAARGGTEARRVGDWPARPSGKTVTLGDDLTLDDALQRIADAAGWNLVANTGRAGDTTLRAKLRDVPVEEALDAVLVGSSLVATRSGNTVTVAPGRAPADQPVLGGFDKPSGKRFTGDFADEPVDQALRKVADAAGLSLVLPSGVRGAVTGHFKEAPVEDVLRVILAQAGLTAQREGTILNVVREGGRSLVIRGGKRSIVTIGPDGIDLGPDVDRTIGDALKGARDDARKSAKDARDEARAARKQAREEARAAREAAGGGRRAGDRVLRGDQVIGPGERAGDVVVLAGSVRLEAGATAGQVVAVMGSVSLGPGVTVDQDVVAVGGDVHVEPGAHVGGDAVSVGGKVVIDEGAAVEGQQVSVEVPGLTKVLAIAGLGSWGTDHGSALARALTALVQFIVFFGLGLLCWVVAPRRVEAVTGSLHAAPVKGVLTGILGALAVPIVGILLAATVIGIPFIAVLALAVVVALALGFAALALLIGRLVPLHLDRGAPIAQLAIGTAVLVALGRIPVLGIMTWLAAGLFVFGVVLRTRFGRPPGAPPPVYGTMAPPPMPPPMPPPATGTASR